MCEKCSAIFHTDTSLETPNKGCLNPGFCNRTFTVSYMNQYESYVRTNYNILKNIVVQCCGYCGKVEAQRNLTIITELEPVSKDSPDFVYPVLGEKSSLEKYGYYFVPIYGIDSVVYVTSKRSGLSMLDELIASLPLLIISILLAIMSGFIVWSLDRWKNKDEFPRAFPIGWFEGTWFSFVSMTTVGYGDKAPKSITGKLFAFIWISVKLILCSIITATITTSILDANSPPPPDMKGERVGMMKYRDFEGYVTALLGGRKVEVDVDDFHELIAKLIMKLQRDEIDGFVLDKRTFYYISRGLNNFLSNDKKSTIPEKYRQKIEYFMQKTRITEKRYTGLNLYYGILMRKKEYYNYFSHVIRDNRFVLQRRLEEHMVQSYYNKSLVNRKGLRASGNILFAPDGKYFQRAVSTICVINCVFLLIGVVYEMNRRKNKLAKKKSIANDIKIDAALLVTTKS